MCGPAAVLAWWVAEPVGALQGLALAPGIQRAMAPMVVGLILSGGYVLATPGGSPTGGCG